MPTRIERMRPFREADAALSPARASNRKGPDRAGARAVFSRWPAIPSFAGLLLILTAVATRVDAQSMTIEVYRGGYASVNSFIISNGHALAVIDVQRKVGEAEKLADVVRSKKLPLAYILVTHGHTDHFTGIAFFHREFPRARIVVASAQIKQDIRDYARYMERGGATASEPALDPSLRELSAANPDGFDYERTIEVLEGGRLNMPGGGALALNAGYPPTEAPHMTTVYSKDLNALFLADLGYNEVHLWLGDDATAVRIAAWRIELLRIQSAYRELNPTVYPGHGEPTDLSLISRMVAYLDDFVNVTNRAGSAAAAQLEMERRYPHYREADFFLKYSVEHFLPSPANAR
jgi:glyoxylase-like metal-dependent hydrolase (beta-lactamase superfamily II)